MDDLTTKVKKFQDSCLKLAKSEALDLDNKIADNIKLETEDELNRYRKEAKYKLDRQIYKIEKDFNSNIYEAKNSSKIAVISKEKKLMEALEQELVKRLYFFTDLKEYEIFLLNNISDVIEKLEKKENGEITIYITQKDYDKYLTIINKEFGCNVKITKKEIIGGCIGENINENLLIDNSLSTLLKEEISKINLKNIS